MAAPLNPSRRQCVQGLEVMGKATMPRKVVSNPRLLGELLSSRFPVTAWVANSSSFWNDLCCGCKFSSKCVASFVTSHPKCLVHSLFSG